MKRDVCPYKKERIVNGKKRCTVLYTEDHRVPEVTNARVLQVVGVPLRRITVPRFKVIGPFIE